MRTIFSHPLICKLSDCITREEKKEEEEVMYSSNRVGVYHEDRRVGEMEIYPPKESEQKQQQEDDVMMKQRQKKQREVMEEMKMGIRISHFSQPSERCPPLAVLTTVSSSGLCFKLEASTSSPVQEQLCLFYSSCLRDNKV